MNRLLVYIAAVEWLDERNDPWLRLAANMPGCLQPDPELVIFRRFILRELHFAGQALRLLKAAGFRFDVGDTAGMPRP